MKLKTKQMFLQHRLLLKLDKEIELSCKFMGREFHAVMAEKPKLRIPNVFMHTSGISSWRDVEELA